MTKEERIKNRADIIQTDIQNSIGNVADSNGGMIPPKTTYQDLVSVLLINRIASVEVELEMFKEELAEALS